MKRLSSSPIPRGPCRAAGIQRKESCQGVAAASLAPTLLLLVLAGCVPVPKGGDLLDVRFMSTEELRDYSEQVFRHQNRVTTRLMMAPVDSESIGGDDLRRIERAESRMNDACASLNEVASARSAGEDVDIELENRVRRKVRMCAERTEQLEDILDELEI